MNLNLDMANQIRPKAVTKNSYITKLQKLGLITQIDIQTAEASTGYSHQHYD